MSKKQMWTVIVTRDITESTVIRDVRASSADAAETKVLEQAGRYGENLEHWQTGDGNMNEAYVTDVTEQE